MCASHQSGAAADTPAHISSHLAADITARLSAADDASARTATAHCSASCRAQRTGRAGTPGRPAAGSRTSGGHAAAHRAEPTPGSVVVRPGAAAEARGRAPAATEEAARHAHGPRRPRGDDRRYRRGRLRGHLIQRCVTQSRTGAPRAADSRPGRGTTAPRCSPGREPAFSVASARASARRPRARAWWSREPAHSGHFALRQCVQVRVNRPTADHRVVPVEKRRYLLVRQVQHQAPRDLLTILGRQGTTILRHGPSTSTRVRRDFKLQRSFEVRSPISRISHSSGAPDCSHHLGSSRICLLDRPSALTVSSRPWRPAGTLARCLACGMR
jgi:hypothetical protein